MKFISKVFPVLIFTALIFLIFHLADSAQDIRGKNSKSELIKIVNCPKIELEDDGRFLPSNFKMMGISYKGETYYKVNPNKREYAKADNKITGCYKKRPVEHLVGISITLTKDGKILLNQEDASPIPLKYYVTNNKPILGIENNDKDLAIIAEGEVELPCIRKNIKLDSSKWKTIDDVPKYFLTSKDVPSVQRPWKKELRTKYNNYCAILYDIRKVSDLLERCQIWTLDIAI